MRAGRSGLAGGFGAVLATLLCVGALTGGLARDAGQDARVDLSPRVWPEGELDRYWAIANNAAPYKEATGTRAMIAGTSGPVAIRGGLEALLRGGTAADAVVTTALSQIVLAAGCWVSFAGRVTGVYYDAATGEVQALNANYDVPRGETDPMSIPTARPSGRSALVPGFMAGMEALHTRYGALPWASLFTPAIHLAEEGFVLRPNEANLIRNRADVLGRLPDTRAVFTHPDGRWYQAGDRFRQTALGATLRAVADSGASYMYAGGWGRRLVDAVSAEGGRMTLADLEAYEVDWHEPVVGHFAGATIHGLQPPNLGGPITAEVLTLADAAGLSTEHGSYVESPEALHGLMQIAMVPWILRSEGGAALLRARLPGLEAAPGSVSPADAGRIWQLIESAEWSGIRTALDLPGGEFSEHSDAVVAIDEQGNVAAIIHTINTVCWGTTGIFVDGVSIPNSGANQRAALRTAGPGGRVSDAGPPILVLRDGEPVLASSATGGENVSVTWQNLYNILGLGMTPKESVDRPNFYFDAVQQGTFPAATLEGVRGLGMPIRETPTDGSGNALGFWVGIARDPTTGSLRSGVIRWLDGIAIGY